MHILSRKYIFKIRKFRLQLNALRGAGRQTPPLVNLTPARKNFCGSTASPSIRVS